MLNKTDENELNLECQLINGRNYRICSAVKATVMLSAIELERYCLSAAHRECPVFQAYQTPLGRKLTLKEYSDAHLFDESLFNEIYDDQNQNAAEFSV